MLPTLNISTITNLDGRGDLAQNLLPRDATQPVASFAESLHSSLPLREAQPAGLNFELTLPPDTGKLLPADGKALPDDLRALIDELKNLLGVEPGSGGVPASTGAVDAAVPLEAGGETGDEAILRLTEFPVLEAALPGVPLSQAGSTGEARGLSGRQPDPAMRADEVRLPPGLEFRTTLSTASVDPAAKERLLPAGPVTVRPPQETLSQLAKLVDLPEDRIQTAIEQRAVSVADLERIVDALKDRLTRAEPVAGMTPKSPIPAATIRLDGTMTEGRPERFRPIGVGQPSPSLVGLDMAEVDRPLVRQDVLVAEAMQKEGLMKPQPGGLQIHATSVPPSQASPTQFSLGQSQQFQPVDVKVAGEAIQTPVRDPAWGDRLGERVVMMANNRLQNVDIRLSPAELGPLRVSVSLDDGAATVSFVAQHAVTREAIEAALPRLRSMLEENGIGLGQASVEQDGPQDGKAESGGDGNGGDGRSAGAGTAGSEADAPDAAPVRLSRGLLDTFV